MTSKRNRGGKRNLSTINLLTLSESSNAATFITDQRGSDQVAAIFGQSIIEEDTIFEYSPVEISKMEVVALTFWQFKVIRYQICNIVQIRFTSQYCKSNNFHF